MAEQTVAVSRPLQPSRWRSHHSPWVRVRRLARTGTGVISLALILLFALCALASPLIAPFGANEQDYSSMLQSPSSSHLLGTDELGRDLLSRVIYGARISIGIGVGASVGGVAIATLIAVVCATFRGTLDLLLQRIVDILIGFPGIVLILVAMVSFGGTTASQRSLVLVVTLWVILAAGSARIIRANAILVAAQPYILAAESIGVSRLRIMFRHILPNLLPIIIVMASIQVGAGILVESSLAYLGYGIPAPTPAWGSMLGVQGLANMYTNPWMVIWPGVCITLAVYAFNMFGDVLRDLLDPRLGPEEKR